MEFERLEDKYDLRDYFSSVKFFSYAGMPMGEFCGAVTEEWGVKVVTHHAGDTGTAWEGPGFDGYQLWEDTMFPEVVDPVRRPHPRGRDRRTDRHRPRQPGRPYIRFRSGDLVRVSREPDPVGRTHTRMWVLGRQGDETMIDGRPSRQRCGASSKPNRAQRRHVPDHPFVGSDDAVAAADRLRTRTHHRRRRRGKPGRGRPRSRSQASVSTPP